ncbi:class I SAM-dependent methyltransferase [Biformimicrobium ophioploci]|uniref:Class I SAM-dependent methyltransferase n=1 Tax=Biformimicrobium ophioploci TaxID=3036711 RepID=A0ABQ6LW82_9GAMM|nr:methyltransferase [Microbulbifer sp. NKW57]GMG86342.1 class I SAM-dependent methyltransferase [Microbulbifer sp. NKW57]
MKRFALILAALGAMPSYAIDETALQAAVDGKHRTEAYTARDTYRNPVQTLTLFDIQPHHTVVEVWPGGGWYTEILAPYLQKDGRLIAAHYDSSDTQASYRPGSRERFEKKLAGNKGIYGKVEVSSLTLDEENGILKIGAAKSGEADRVVTFRNLHGMASKGITGAAMAHFFDILKPGGKLGVVQHMADPGQDWQGKNIGYVGRDYVIAEAEKAGFKLHAEGYFNHNEADTKDYEKGVWQLPPTLRDLKTDEEKAPYLAIGESERMTLVFIKPAS